MKKGCRFIGAALLLGAMLMATACGTKEVSMEEKIAGYKQAEKGYDIQLDVEVEVPTVINPLSGLADISAEAVGKRPVAIMVNNVPKSFPQYGIEQASIIFEIPVEGGSTRFMALYADYTQVPEVCSIRSARKYFPAISEGFDAVYVNWGRNEAIIEYLESLNLTQFEGLFNQGDLFARDLERKEAGYSLEHTGYFKGPELPAALERLNRRVDIEEGKEGFAFRFHPYKKLVAPSDEACTLVNIDFGVALATFTYDEESKTYKKSYNGEPQIDGRTGNTLSFTNVFVLETSITADENGLHRDVDWTGGNGYYVSNGNVQKITWSKASESEPLKLYDESGEELTINRGKSYFGINYIGEATFE